MLASPTRIGFIAMLAVCLLFAVAGAAFAYPNELVGYSGDLPRTECTDCHSASENDILNPGSDPDLLAAVRKGPHGGYTTGTSKCQTCHSLHDAPTGGTKLLPGETVKNTCESCHDGTGGTAVYGVIKARTGLEPASAHRIEQTNVIPGGDAGGGSLTGSFMGPGGTLTCSDCHAPHDNQTIAPFTGDRLRSTVASDTAYATESNRLLRQAPTGSVTTVSAYGANWCATCHAGRSAQHAPESGALQNHPVMQDDSYTYDNLPVVSGVGSLTTALGKLGQSNRGYVMPGPTLSEPTLKTPLQQGYAPLCQQCHEDMRSVGPSVRQTNPTLKSAAQEFSVTQPDGLSATDNPRFQVFPHESDADNFLVRAPAPTEPYSLCLSCHSLVHNATLGSGFVEVFDAKHDSAASSSDGIIAPCTTCHVTALLPAHDNRCTACHPAPYDTLGGSWGNTCQQGGCHVTYHNGPFDAHFEAFDTQPCTVCHPSATWWPTTVQCLGCHASPASAALPVTFSNTQATYNGAALIDFELTKGGKAAIGTTYYRVDAGIIMVGETAVITTAGAHTIEFWSVDQNGITETPHKTANFTITADTTPPVTTSNAPATQYYYPAQITLTATDASSFGVKATYYSLDGGPTTTGTFLSVPAPTGIVPHTLQFWSEDWSGNVEATKTVNFTVVGGTATLRLVSGNLPAGYWVEWLVWKGSRDATPDYTVSQVGPYNSYDDLVLPVSATTYWVVATWGTPTEPYDEDPGFSVLLTTPGQLLTY